MYEKMYLIRIATDGGCYWYPQEVPSAKGRETVEIEHGQRILLTSYTDDGDVRTHMYIHRGEHVEELEVIYRNTAEHTKAKELFGAYLYGESTDDFETELTFKQWLRFCHNAILMN